MPKFARRPRDLTLSHEDAAESAGAPTLSLNVMRKAYCGGAAIACEHKNQHTRTETVRARAKSLLLIVLMLMHGSAHANGVVLLAVLGSPHNYTCPLTACRGRITRIISPVGDRKS